MGSNNTQGRTQGFDLIKISAAWWVTPATDYHESENASADLATLQDKMVRASALYLRDHGFEPHLGSNSGIWFVLLGEWHLRLNIMRVRMQVLIWGDETSLVFCEKDTSRKTEIFVPLPARINEPLSLNVGHAARDQAEMYASVL